MSGKRRLSDGKPREELLIYLTPPIWSKESKGGLLLTAAIEPPPLRFSVCLEDTNPENDKWYSAKLTLKFSPGDGNCLLHSLDPGCDVVAMRKLIIEKLHEEGALNMEVGDLYNEEADALEDDPDLWGGQFSMLVFSKMRNVKVLVHDTSDLDHILYDNTYSEVPSTALEVHVAYNGRDHYDGIEIDDVNDDSAEPSSAKRRRISVKATPPGSTQEMVLAEGSRREKQSNKREVDAEADLRATPSKRSRAFTVKPSLKSPQPTAKKLAAVPPVPRPVCKRVPAPMRRRCRHKVPAPPAYKLTIYEEVCRAQLRYPSKHPHVELEDEMLPIKSALRADPTLPPGRLEASIDNGDLWPDVFCAFVGCTWEKMRGTEADLLQHLKEEHFDELIHAAKVLPIKVEEDVAILSVYNEAIADILRTQAPLAGPSLDRKALRSFSEASKGDNVEALVCFCCGCIHTCVAEEEDKNKIQWVFPVEHTKTGETTLFGMPVNTAKNLVGMDTFKKKYGKVDGYANITDTDELHEWRAFVYDTSEEDFVEFMCCPEDHVCLADLNHPRDHLLCEECRVPLCSHCRGHLDKHKLPPLSLANDMWTGFAPAVLYHERVTVMEMICASPCITTLLCFSMEARYHNDHLFDEKAHMARHRIGARGNALTFPLPWEQLIDTLQRSVAEEELEQQEESPTNTSNLPWTGKELEEHVRVLLKTNKHGETTEAELKTLIHQATVRRDVVVKLIMHMKAHQKDV